MTEGMTIFAGGINECELSGLTEFVGILIGIFILSILAYFAAKLSVGKSRSVWLIAVCAVLIFIFSRILSGSIAQAESCDKSAGNSIFLWTVYGSSFYAYLVLRRLDKSNLKKENKTKNKKRSRTLGKKLRKSWQNFLNY